MSDPEEHPLYTLSNHYTYDPVDFCGALNSIHTDSYEKLTSHARWLKEVLLLVENTPVCVSISSYKKTRTVHNPLVYVNKCFESTTQYHRKDIVGKNCNFLQGTIQDLELVTRNFMRDTIISGKNGKFLITNYKRDGTAFRNLLYLVPIKYTTGEICYYMGLQTDLSDPNTPYNYIMVLDELLDLIPKEIVVEDDNIVSQMLTNSIRAVSSYKEEQRRAEAPNMQKKPHKRSSILTPSASSLL